MQHGYGANIIVVRTNISIKNDGNRFLFLLFIWLRKKLNANKTEEKDGAEKFRHKSILIGEKICNDFGLGEVSAAEVEQQQIGVGKLRRSFAL